MGVLTLKIHCPFLCIYSISRVLTTKNIRPGWESSIMTGSIEVVDKCGQEKGLNY